MADPPPPSYDEAITGDFKDPPPPSSPPPPESTPPPSWPPLQSSDTEVDNFHLNGEETRRLNTRQHHAQRGSYINDAAENCSSRGSDSNQVCKWIACLVACGVVILVGVGSGLGGYFSEKTHDSRVNCKTEPPREDHIGVKWIHCSKNKKGEYEHMTECKFKCQDGLFMHAYDTQGYPDYESHTSGYYMCQQEEWEYMMEDGSYRKFQCLPPSDPAKDCDLNELKNKISGTPNPKLKDCPRKFRKDGDYSFSGTKCTLQCPSQHSFWMQSFDKKLVKGPKTVDFRCQNSTWVSPTNVKSKHIQCIKNSASRLDCKNNIGMELKNCLQNYRGGYFPGTKCNLECQENYSLYAYGNDSSLLFNSKAVLEPMNPKVEITCKSKTSGTWHFKQPLWTFALADGSKIQDKRFQCLPPSNSSSSPAAKRKHRANGFK